MLQSVQERKEMEQEKRKNDIVLDNIELSGTPDERDLDRFFQNTVNKTLLGEIISDGDLIKTTPFRKRGSQKWTLIAKLKDVSIKKAILKQKKMFWSLNCQTIFFQF